MSFLEHLISFMHVPPADDHPAELTGLRERVELYGNPGLTRGDADPVWVKRNIVEFHGSQALPGIPPKFYFQTHRLAVPHLRRALERALAADPRLPGLAEAMRQAQDPAGAALAAGSR